MSGDYYWNDGKISNQNEWGGFQASSMHPTLDYNYSIEVSTTNLYVQNAGTKVGGHSLRCKNSGLFPAGSSAARSYPVSLVLSGLYEWSNGSIYNQGDNGVGYFWTSYADSSLNSFSFYVRIGALSSARFDKVYGLSLRSFLLLALALLVVIRCPWCCQEITTGIKIMA